MKNYYTALSEEILATAKSDGDSSALRRQLFYILPSKLENSLDCDDLRKTFWINIYHAFYLIISKETLDNTFIYEAKRIKIARSILSLNDIEHGILRKLKYKMGFGYLTNPFYSDFIKACAVQELDYRIHFALGSIYLEKTTVDYYDSTIIETQLIQTTNNFIQSETKFDSKLKLIRTSRFLFSYFRDFGGMRSVKQLLQTSLKKDIKGYRLQFKSTKKKDKSKVIAFPLATKSDFKKIQY
ncbi:DUF547 domain-containing protein [Flavobacterium sandaracinum]|uniref:DUF547 domain-containing protein n=1 Tax=Flavobacterium sandaracinum TaxID=2541733 RepID=UPI0014049AEC|nr:DUF547 domain-containing protein [Flavobacterium sandaracinum]